MQIEKNIPIPERNPIDYKIILNMQVGESVELPKEAGKKAYSVVRPLAAQKGRKFTSKSTERTIRIWRTS